MMHIKSTLIFRDLLNASRNLLNTSRYFLIVSNNASTKSLEEKVGLPPKPKRPLTPYFRFMQQLRPSITAENPNANIKDVVRIAATKWKSVDDATKKKLEDEYKKDQLVYIEKRAKYDSKLTDTQKADIKSLKQEMHDAKERRAYRKRVKELGKPKRPPSSFIRFILLERSVSPPSSNSSYKDWLQSATEKWSRLSDADKQKFKNETKKDIEKYKLEVSKWENKMIRLGHIDVVRQDALVDPPSTSPKIKKIA